MQHYVYHKRKVTHHGKCVSVDLYHMGRKEEKRLNREALYTFNHLNGVDKHFVQRVKQGVVAITPELAQDCLDGKFKVIQKTMITTPVYDKKGDMTDKLFKDERVLIQMDRDVERAYDKEHTSFVILNNVYYVVSLTRKTMVTGYVSERNKFKKSIRGVLK